MKFQVNHWEHECCQNKTGNESLMYVWQTVVGGQLMFAGGGGVSSYEGFIRAAEVTPPLSPTISMKFLKSTRLLLCKVIQRARGLQAVPPPVPNHHLLLPAPTLSSFIHPPSLPPVQQGLSCLRWTYDLWRSEKTGAISRAIKRFHDNEGRRSHNVTLANTSVNAQLHLSVRSSSMHSRRVFINFSWLCPQTYSRSVMQHLALGCGSAAQRASPRSPTK